LHPYGDRILPFDLAAARIAGALSDVARSRGSTPGFADIAIAATAHCRGLTLLTRNTRHFAPLGLPAVNPFERLPIKKLTIKAEHLAPHRTRYPTGASNVGLRAEETPRQNQVHRPRKSNLRSAMQITV
jgi:hypothetical protein